MGDAETGALDDGRVAFEREQARDEEPRIMARDPVCGMDVDPAGAAAHSEYRGVPYYFCATACKREFDAHPVRYVGS